MGSKIEYVESSDVYTTKYVRNSKAIGVLWGVFTICFAIINVVVFVQPQWIGDTVESRGTGYFGLWKHCTHLPDGQTVVCRGKLDDFSSIISPAFRAATVFVGLSAGIVLLCICCMLFFFFLHSSTVFYICGWLQVFSASCLLVGVLAFPVGWDAPQVREVCGPRAKDYSLGECGIRWAYILAVIGVLDSIVLAALSFVLATRTVKLQQPEPLYAHTGSAYRGEVNTGFVADSQSLAGSRKSMNLQPVMLMPHPEHDRFSEYSHHTGRSKNSAYRPQYPAQYHHPSTQNFQL